MSNDNQIERLWKLQATVNKLVLDGKRDPREVSDILQGILESRPQQRWREEDGVIYFSVGPTDGTTGEGWIYRLKSKGIDLSGEAREVLQSPDFKPTSGVTTEVAVLRGRCFSADDSSIEDIRAYSEGLQTSDKRKLIAPSAELACLIREKFTDKEIEAMRLRDIIVMHEPLHDLCRYSYLLGTCLASFGRWFCAHRVLFRIGWHRDNGFAFEVEARKS